VPRIFGRPFELKPGQGLSLAQLVQRLNDVGYAERPKAAAAGEFSVAARR
jgi:transcription-repair coupling factor (superfamily II helicase)